MSSDDAERGVQNPLMIDLIGWDPHVERFVLYMIESRPWEDSPERFDQLKKKVNGYLYYVVSGQLPAQYPDTVGKPLQFELICAYPPEGATLAFLEEIRARLATRNITLSLRVSRTVATP